MRTIARQKCRNIHAANSHSPVAIGRPEKSQGGNALANSKALAIRKNAPTIKNKSQAPQRFDCMAKRVAVREVSENAWAASIACDGC